MDTYEPLYLRESRRYFMSEKDIISGKDRPAQEGGGFGIGLSVTAGLREMTSGMARPGNYYYCYYDYPRFI